MAFYSDLAYNRYISEYIRIPFALVLLQLPPTVITIIKLLFRGGGGVALT